MIFKMEISSEKWGCRYKGNEEGEDRIRGTKTQVSPRATFPLVILLILLRS